MESVTQVQILAEAACLSLCTNALEKNAWIHLFSLQLQVDSRAELVKQAVKKEENSEFKPAVLHLYIDLCHILLVVKGLSKYMYC